MAKQKLRITQQGYIVLGAIAVGIIIIALVIFILTCSPKGENLDKDVKGSPAPTATADATADPAAPAPTMEWTPTFAPEETLAPTAEPTATAEPVATPEPTAAPTATPELPSALTTPSEEMVSKAVTGNLVKGNVNMRKGPGKTFAVDEKGLKNGAKLTVYAKYDEWYFVKMEGQSKYGYITDGFIKLNSPLDSAFIFADKPEGTIEGKINASTCMMRSSASLENDSNKMQAYDLGTKVFIYYKEGDFYYLQVAGTNIKGYMYASFITASGTVPAKT